MSPRPYDLSRRRIASDETRARVVAAARALLVAGKRQGDFTMEAVARQAGVARMTVYYQFGSKRGLTEAVCDALALQGGMERMPEVFRERDPHAALRALIGLMAGFYASDRELTRRLHGLAALDADLAHVMEDRNLRRREALRVLLNRLREAEGVPADPSLQPSLDLLHTLTSFETYDRLAGEHRTREEVTDLQTRLAEAVLALEKDGADDLRKPP